MKNVRIAGRLFLQFLKIGCFTFGGGWSILAQLRKNYVEGERFISNEELLDIVSVGRSLPGIMICNVSLLFGFRTAGVLGGIACVLGLVIPPMLVMVAVTMFYTAVSANPWIAATMMGVRAAVVPIIVDALINMSKSAFRYPPCYLVTVLAFSMYLFFDIGCSWIVLVGAVCGLFICGLCEKQPGGGNDDGIA